MFVYTAIAMTAMLCVVSLAVDVGHMQLVKTQLQAAADAAARYGSTGASDGTYAAKAISAAAANTVDMTPLALTAADIQTITYSSGTYSIGGSSPNGIKITAQRSKARGSAIQTLFARVLGVYTIDIHATSVAYSVSAMPAYGFVGINTALLQNGTIYVDSYKSAAGAYGASNLLNHGYVASNGGITLTGGVTVSDDLYMIAGQSLTTNGSPDYGTRKALTSSLTYPAVSSAPGGSTNLGNVNGGMTLGSGSTNTNYYVTSLSLGSGQTLNINGPVTLYINGNCTLNGTVVVVNNLPSNFAIRMMSGAGVNVQTTTLYADIYAPNSPINFNSVSNFYGRIIGSQLNISNTGSYHYDESLPALPGTAQAPAAAGGSSGNVEIIQ